MLCRNNLRCRGDITSRCSQHVKPKLDQNIYTAEGSMLDALCRRLSYDLFSESSLPPSQGFPLKKVGVPARMNKVRRTCALPSLFGPSHPGSCKAGYSSKPRNAIGLHWPGICCNRTTRSDLRASRALYPLVLRPEGSDDYKVVGECYIHGIINGEAFLGPMPSNWRCVICYSPHAKAKFLTLVNDATGEDSN